ncbi:MAG: histidine kinase [Thermoanaerobaculia bacterium]|nr:histidine kinase [Thermoanaerobaculia bacterium]
MNSKVRNWIFRLACLIFAWLAVSAVLAEWIRLSLRIATGNAPPWRSTFASQLLVWSPWLVLAPVALALGRRWVHRPGGLARWTLRMVAALFVALGLNVGFVAWELSSRGTWSLEATLRVAVANGALPVLVHAFLIALLVGVGWGRQQARLRRRRHELWIEARREALVAKLRPHFLFNALNAVAALVDRDPPAARRMLASVGDLLRGTLEGTDRPEVPLGEEQTLLSRYLDVERVRYGDRLRWEEEILVPDDTLVPPLLLQPLVENAFHHGLARDRTAGLVRLRIEGAGSEEGEPSLRVTVEDDGPGPPPRPRFGIGLGSTRDRLEVLYGPGASLRLGRREPKGAVVEAILPWRRVP